jgi:hypothetical protein
MKVNENTLIKCKDFIYQLSLNEDNLKEKLKEQKDRIYKKKMFIQTEGVWMSDKMRIAAYKKLAEENKAAWDSLSAVNKYKFKKLEEKIKILDTNSYWNLTTKLMKKIHDIQLNKILDTKITIKNEAVWEWINPYKTIDDDFIATIGSQLKFTVKVREAPNAWKDRIIDLVRNGKTIFDRLPALRPIYT